jgi:HD-like signal output (HDOD) protein/CheY-like chemotaxis protein
MLRILFVDDEPRILDAIRRSMYCMRGEWHTRFSGSAAAALQELAIVPADVVISDMRMPGMDGSQLLAEVMRLYPETVRIILSGQAETESIIRASRSAHRYLSKPCDAASLKAAISSSTSLKALLSSDDLAAIVGSVDVLPTPPEIYHELLACLRSPDAAIGDIARIIRHDVAITARVVKLANSGFFGIREPVQTVERAVAFVGMEAITTLVLGLELFGAKRSIAIPGFSVERLGRHSFETAAWARAVAVHEGLSRTVVDGVFLAGVLHDVGKLVLATRAAPTLLPQRATWLAETAHHMLAHHAQIGAYLLGLWGFPDSIVEAVAWHHTPSKGGEPGLGLCSLLHIGDQLAHEHHPDEAHPGTQMLEPGYLEGLGLAGRWAEWQATRSGSESASADGP